MACTGSMRAALRAGTAAATSPTTQATTEAIGHQHRIQLGGEHGHAVGAFEDVGKHHQQAIGQQRAQHRAHQPHQAALQQKDRHDASAPDAHGAQDADLALLLHHAHHQHAGDAQRHDDDHEAADQVVGGALVGQRIEQARVGLHPAVHAEAGARAQAHRPRRRRQTGRSPSGRCWTRPPAEIQQGLAELEGHEHPAPVEVAVAHVKQAADGPASRCGRWRWSRAPCRPRSRPGPWPGRCPSACACPVTSKRPWVM